MEELISLLKALIFMTIVCVVLGSGFLLGMAGGWMIWIAFPGLSQAPEVLQVFLFLGSGIGGSAAACGLVRPLYQRFYKW